MTRKKTQKKLVIDSKSENLFISTIKELFGIGAWRHLSTPTSCDTLLMLFVGAWIGAKAGEWLRNVERYIAQDFDMLLVVLVFVASFTFTVFLVTRFYCNICYISDPNNYRNQNEAFEVAITTAIFIYTLLVGTHLFETGMMFSMGNGDDITVYFFRGVLFPILMWAVLLFGWLFLAIKIRINRKFESV